jgi:hypothetical protein
MIMARTTDTAVKALFRKDPKLILDSFIETASHLVDRACATAVDSEGAAYYSDSELELIERWLAAHFYEVAVAPAQQERAGSVGQIKATKVDLGLNLTRYGQQALVLDTAGGLQALMDAGSRVTPGVAWLGTEIE